MNSRADVKLQLLMFCDWLLFHCPRHFVDCFLEVGDGIWICDLGSQYFIHITIVMCNTLYVTSVYSQLQMLQLVYNSNIDFVIELYSSACIHKKIHTDKNSTVTSRIIQQMLAMLLEGVSLPSHILKRKGPHLLHSERTLKKKCDNINTKEVDNHRNILCWC